MTVAPNAHSFLSVTVSFLKYLFFSLAYTSPIWAVLVIAIFVCGLLIGRREGWSRGESLYFAFITATTVGYGDYRPTKKGTRLLAIFLAFTGLVLTGLIVALAVFSAGKAIETYALQYGIPEFFKP